MAPSKAPDRQRIPLARVVTAAGDVAGEAGYAGDHRTIAMMEMAALNAARAARARFRRLVANQAARLPWDALTLATGGACFRLVPWGHPTVTEGGLVAAYQAIWANATIYRKRFTPAEARAIVRQLHDGLVWLDATGDVIGLVAGWPVAATPDAPFAALVDDVETAVYLAEWGLADSSARSPWRGLGLGTLALALYLLAHIAGGVVEFVLTTAERGYDGRAPNTARPLYEAHGFVPCRDGAGRPVTWPVRHLRLDGRLQTHRSMFYRATAADIQAALRPEVAAVDGFQFITEAGERCGS